jgi:hypothetical protein
MISHMKNPSTGSVRARVHQPPVPAIRKVPPISKEFEGVYGDLLVEEVRGVHGWALDASEASASSG